MNKEAFYVDVLGLSKGELTYKLAEASTVLKVRKGYLLVKEGEVQHNVLLMIKGICRGFYVNESGHEITEYFGFRQGDFAVKYEELGLPASICIEAVTEVEYISIPVNYVRNIIETSYEFADNYHRFLRNNIIEHYSLESILRRDAMSKYLWFIKTYEGLIDKVRHYDIASFLNITPVTLSRLRKKIREKR